MTKHYTLVTGGAGFIGSHVSEYLLQNRYNVVVLDDLSGGFRENVPSSATFVHGSITNESLVKEIFQTYSIDHIFHLAAYAAENLSHFIRKFNYENNIIGSINLINAAILHNVKCFVFTSSIAAYGDIPSPMKEEDRPSPCDPYGIAKLAVEQDLRAAHELFGLNHVIFRPHNVYGERQNMEDKYRNVVTIFTNQLLQGKPVTIFGDGMQTRSFSYVGDVARTIAHAVDVPTAYNKTFNIGSDEVISVRSLADLIAQKLNVSPTIQSLKERKEVKHAHADHTLVREILDYKTTTPLDTGIKHTIAWAKQAGIRKTAEFTHIEIRKQLPEGW